jgi:hypothetical protein
MFQAKVCSVRLNMPRAGYSEQEENERYKHFKMEMFTTPKNKKEEQAKANLIKSNPDLEIIFKIHQEMVDDKAARIHIDEDNGASPEKLAADKMQYMKLWEFDDPLHIVSYAQDRKRRLEKQAKERKAEVSNDAGRLKVAAKLTNVPPASLNIGKQDLVQQRKKDSAFAQRRYIARRPESKAATALPGLLAL